MEDLIIKLDISTLNISELELLKTQLILQQNYYDAAKVRGFIKLLTGVNEVGLNLK